MSRGPALLVTGGARRLCSLAPPGPVAGPRAPASGASAPPGSWRAAAAVALPPRPAFASAPRLPAPPGLRGPARAPRPRRLARAGGAPPPCFAPSPGPSLRSRPAALCSLRRSARPSAARRRVAGVSRGPSRATGACWSARRLSALGLRCRWSSVLPAGPSARPRGFVVAPPGWRPASCRPSRRVGPPAAVCLPGALPSCRGPTGSGPRSSPGSLRGGAVRGGLALGGGAVSAPGRLPVFSDVRALAGVFWACPLFCSLAPGLGRLAARPWCGPSAALLPVPARPAAAGVSPPRSAPLPLLPRPSGGPPARLPAPGALCPYCSPFFPPRRPSGLPRPGAFSALPLCRRPGRPPAIWRRPPLFLSRAPHLLWCACSDGPPGCLPAWRPPRLCAPSPRPRRLRFARPPSCRVSGACPLSRRVLSGWLPAAPRMGRSGLRRLRRRCAPWAGSLPFRGLCRGGSALPASLGGAPPGAPGCPSRRCSPLRPPPWPSRRCGLRRPLFRRPPRPALGWCSRCFPVLLPRLACAPPFPRRGWAPCPSRACRCRPLCPGCCAPLRFVLRPASLRPGRRLPCSGGSQPGVWARWPSVPGRLPRLVRPVAAPGGRPAWSLPCVPPPTWPPPPASRRPFSAALPPVGLCPRLPPCPRPVGSAPCGFRRSFRPSVRAGACRLGGFLLQPPGLRPRSFGAATVPFLARTPRRRGPGPCPARGSPRPSFRFPMRVCRAPPLLPSASLSPAAARSARSLAAACPPSAALSAPFPSGPASGWPPAPPRSLPPRRLPRGPCLGPDRSAWPVPPVSVRRSRRVGPRLVAPARASPQVAFGAPSPWPAQCGAPPRRRPPGGASGPCPVPVLGPRVTPGRAVRVCGAPAGARRTPLRAFLSPRGPPPRLPWAVLGRACPSPAPCRAPPHGSWGRPPPSAFTGAPPPLLSPPAAAPAFRASPPPCFARHWASPAAFGAAWRPLRRFPPRRCFPARRLPPSPPASRP